MYIVDQSSDEKYFIVSLNGEEIMKIAKSCNTLEKVINLVGKENVLEVI